MKQSEFAATHGVSRKTVTQWKQRGWVVMTGDEVDVAASNALLKKYRTGASKTVTRAVTPEAKVTNTVPDAEVTVRDGETIEGAADRILSAAGAFLDIDEAKRMKENYFALLNQLEYDQKSGLVVEVAAVARVVGVEFAKVRTRLLAIPSEQAPRIHRCKTPAEVQDVLQVIITEALEELTRDGATA